MACGRSSFGRIHSSDIQGAALIGLSEAEVFTLGVEWGIVWGRLKSAAPFVEAVHMRNEGRIASALMAQGRRFSTSLGPVGFVTFSVRGLD